MYLCLLAFTSTNYIALHRFNQGFNYGNLHESGSDEYDQVSNYFCRQDASATRSDINQMYKPTIEMCAR